MQTSNCHTNVGKTLEMGKLGKDKDKVPLYSLLSVGPGADPGVQSVSPQVTF